LRFAPTNSGGFEELKHLAEPRNRLVHLDGVNYLQLIENQEYRSGFMSITTMDLVIRTDNFALVFLKNSPFYETFNKKIMQMISNGIIEHWFRNVNNPTGLKRKIEEIGPQILTLDHLDVGFLMCLTVLGFSFLLFCAELIARRFDAWRENMTYILTRM